MVSTNNPNFILWSLLPVLLAFIFLFFIVYRIRREGRIKEKEIEQKRLTAEMEMKALRAQMNPHFIFNCMQSIYQFITKNKNKEAGEYLLKFSKLMRLILENSIHKEIALEDEFEALLLYMDLEKLRVTNGFEYEIKIDPSIDVKNTFIPPLLLQPFVENSIWHGFAQKTNPGKIEIKVTRNMDFLIISLTDNGIQSIKPEVAIGKKKSFGLQLTSERIDLLNESRNEQLGLKMTDLFTNQLYSGKKIDLTLPFRTDD